MSQPYPDPDVGELKRLVDELFRAVSFEPGHAPAYDDIHGSFIAAVQSAARKAWLREVQEKLPGWRAPMTQRLVQVSGAMVD